MTIHSFFVGGTALRVVILMVGIWFCITRKGDRGVVAAHLLSITVLTVIVFSREWATVIGIPATALVVERLTRFVELKIDYKNLHALVEKQQGENEHLTKLLTERRASE